MNIALVLKKQLLFTVFCITKEKVTVHPSEFDNSYS